MTKAPSHTEQNSPSSRMTPQEDDGRGTDTAVTGQSTSPDVPTSLPGTGREVGTPDGQV